MDQELFVRKHDAVPDNVFNFYSNKLEPMSGIDSSQLYPTTSMWDRLSPLIVHEPLLDAPSTSPQHTILFLHGLGGSGDDSKAYAKFWQETCPGLRVVAPTAPKLAISMNFGLSFNAWFDLKSLGSDEKTIIEETKEHGFIGLHRSVVWIRQLIHEICEKYSIRPHSIILGGFSQGAALALAVGLQSELNLAGIFSFSGFYPTIDADHGQKQLSLFVNATKTHPIPIFHSGGGEDEIICPWASERLNEEFSRAKVPSWSYHFYPKMHHTVSKAAMKDFMTWLSEVASAAPIPVQAAAEPKRGGKQAVGKKQANSKPAQGPGTGLTVDTNPEDEKLDHECPFNVELTPNHTSYKSFLSSIPQLGNKNIPSAEPGSKNVSVEEPLSTKSTDSEFSFYDILASPVHKQTDDEANGQETGAQIAADSFDLIGIMINDTSNNSTASVPENSILSQNLE